MITMSFAGRIGRDAELRNTGDGKPVASFSVGCNTGRDKTKWVDCAIFGDRAEKLVSYLKKGTPVAISGSPNERAWVKDGEARSVLQCRVDQITLLGSKSDSQPAQGGHAPSSLDNEDIPFSPEFR